MELKKRETIENVNFNQKGEQIEEGELDGAAKRTGKKVEFSTTSLHEKKTGEDVIAPLGENTQKDVAVSSQIDSSIPVSNGSPLEDTEMKQKRKKQKKVFAIVAAFLFIFLGVGGAFGIELRDTYLAKIPLEKILKGDAQVVFNLNSNTDFEQYGFLDDNLRKFPGFQALEKELDEYGEGKTLSQSFQDELKDHNLSFTDDIKPVIGDEIIVVIPTIDPLTDELKKIVSRVGERSKNALRMRELKGNGLAQFKSLKDLGEVKVLGLTSDLYSEEAMEPKTVDPVDFMIGAKIKSLREARRVLKKIKADTNKYEVTENKHIGYLYYKIKRKDIEADLQEGVKNAASSVLETYHALIGSNWIMATKEADLKEMIAVRKEAHLLSKAKFWNKEKAQMQNLFADKRYQTIRKDLRIEGQDGFASGYLKADYNKLAAPVPGPNGESVQLFKGQDNDLLLGILFRATPEGIAFRTASNQINLSGVQDAPIAEGIIKSLPKNVNSRWTDLYSESTNIKDLYYSFKKNNLTSEGAEMWNEGKDSFKQMLGTDFDFETDFIDKLSGNFAIAGFTSKGLSPEGAIIADVVGEEEVLVSVRKIVELIKKVKLMTMSAYGGGLIAPPMVEPNYSTGEPTDIPFEQSDQMAMLMRAPSLSEEALALIEAQKKAIMESQLIETQSDFGAVYSYELAPELEYSLNLGFKDGRMIIASSKDMVVELMRESGNGNAVKMVKDPEFERINKNLYPDGYSKTFITPLGIWNGATYFIDKYAGPINSQEDRDAIEAIGVVVRTLNSISGIEKTSAYAEGRSLSKAAIFLDIKEVEKGEKEWAESVLEKLN